MTALADTFISALHRLESDRDIETIANLFADDASVSNPLVSYDDGGADAAKTFWSHYRDAFDEISSEFRAVTETDGVAFLEWRSHGAIDGETFEYGGVSVLEEADGKISSFRTYFDSARIPRARSAGGEGSGRSASPQGEQTGKDEGSDDLDKAQREAAEQRAQGGYS